MSAVAEATRELTPLQRAQGGDHDGFAELVAAHEAMVFSLVRNFFNDRGRAEELAQDVFLQLYRSLGEIESSTHLVRWLRQVTVRRCIDAVRRSHIRAVPLEWVPEPESSWRPADPLLDRRLRALVASLPETQRAVVTLRYQEDLDASEMSRILGLPVNTVKSHLHRALLSLRRNLGDGK